MTDISSEVTRLKALIESSQKILITSHISPDPDAVSSLLLTGMTLIKSFPNKQIKMILEEEPLALNFLNSYDNIIFQNLAEAIEHQAPDLIILLDGNNFDRASRHNGDKVRELIKNGQIKVAIIDHHEIAGRDKAEVFINRHDPATAQTAYEILLKDLNLNPPEAAVQTALTGYYADTGGFVYLKDGGQKTVFGFVEELVSNGGDIGTIKNRLEQYSLDDMKVIAELAHNVNQTADYTYSYIGDGFMSEWLKNHQQSELQRGTGVFLDSFIRNINGRKWGFIVYINTLQGDNIYSVSFRSVNGVKDVAQIANRLGGGGHKSAAGAKLEAESVDQAVDKIKNTIQAHA